MIDLTPSERAQAAGVMAAALEMAQDAADRMNLPYKYGAWPVPDGEAWPDRDALERAIVLACARSMLHGRIEPSVSATALYARIAVLESAQEGEG